MTVKALLSCYFLPAFLTPQCFWWVSASKEKQCAQEDHGTCATLMPLSVPWQAAECVPCAAVNVAWHQLLKDLRDSRHAVPDDDQGPTALCMSRSHTLRPCLSLNSPQRKETRTELHWIGVSFHHQEEWELKRELKFSHKKIETNIFCTSEFVAHESYSCWWNYTTNIALWLA